MIKPNFFIVGFPKCGTTSLANYLANHPEIYFSPVKEPHYFAPDFTTEAINKYTSEESYQQLFIEAHGYSVVGEGSTAYIYSNESLRLIENYCDHPKYIIVVRNPIDMVQSEHAQMLKSGHEIIKDFHLAWKKSDHRMNGEELPPRVKDRILVSYKEFGRISKYVDRFINRIDRSRIYIMVYEDFKCDPRGEYLKVLQFLNVKDDGRIDFLIINKRSYHRFKIIAKFVNEPPNLGLKINNSLKKVLGIERIGFIDWLRNKNLKQKYLPINKELEEEMKEYFSPEKKYMENLLGRRLPWFIGVGEDS